MTTHDAGSIRARLTLESSEFNRGMDDAKIKMNENAKASENYKKTLDTIQKGAAIMSTATVGAIAAVTNKAADFEAAMSRVSAISGAQGAELKQLSDVARQTGETTVFSSSEAASALELLAMSGMNTQEMIAALPNVLNAASAGQISLAQSADLVTNVMSSFGLSAEETGRAVDVLTKAATTSNSTIPELAGGMKMAAPVANALGLSLEETAASLSILHNNGIKSTESGTAMRAIFLSLSAPVGATKKAIESLGIEVTNADGAMKPLPELIGHIAEKMDGMTEAQKTATAAQLVGREGASALLSLLAEGETGLQNYTKELENSAGAAENVAKVQNDNLLGSFKEFRSALESVSISVGNEYLPAFRQAIEYATSFTRNLGEINPQLITAGLNFVGMSSGIALAATTTLKLTSAMRALFVGSGPVGWGILAASLLGGAIFSYHMEASKASEVNLELADSMKEQHSELSTQIDQFEELRRKSLLSNDEFLRMIDLQSEIAKAVDDSEIEKLTGEFNELLGKSGLSNDEFDRMVGLNDALIEKVPESASQISEQGNRIVETTDVLKDYNSELADATMRELERQRIIAEGREREIKEEIVDLQGQLVEGVAKEEEYKERLKNFDEEASLRRIEEIDYLLETEDIRGRQRQSLLQEKKREEEKLDLYRDQLVEQMKQNDELREKIDHKHDELNVTDEINNRIAELLLTEIGINQTAEEGLALADEKLNKLREEKAQVEEQIRLEGDKGGVLQDHLDSLNQQIGEHERIIGQIDAQTGLVDQLRGKQSEVTEEIWQSYLKAKELDSSLSITDYLKQVEVTDAGTIDALERRASRPITKRVTINATPGNRANVPIAAYHQGGIVGKQSGTLGEIPKLHTGGAVSQVMQDMPMHNEIDVRLLRNEMVLTEGQQASLFRMLQTGGQSKASGNSDALLTQVINQLSLIESRMQQIDPTFDINIDGEAVEHSVSRRQFDRNGIQKIFNGDWGR
ncbi:phage tail tape measure protein [Evansella clarkii]|uniref:phage tail tape measure protein n=1 Tax=Evansella clarkii TaxID=79879 RepID=UPI000B44040C|nr:phage tail tape measure protein [Evansella clarkii]